MRGTKEEVRGSAGSLSRYANNIGYLTENFNFSELGRISLQAKKTATLAAVFLS